MRESKRGHCSRDWPWSVERACRRRVAAFPLTLTLSHVVERGFGTWNTATAGGLRTFNVSPKEYARSFDFRSGVCSLGLRRHISFCGRLGDGQARRYLSVGQVVAEADLVASVADCAIASPSHGLVEGDAALVAFHGP